MVLKNAYSTAPMDVEAGDEFCFVVKLMVGFKNEAGRPVYRVYRCPFEGYEAPQGERIDGALEKKVMEAFFPVVKWANGKADPS